MGAIPDELDDALIEALSIPNLARQEAKEQHTYGWKDMPEEIPLYGLTGTPEDAVLDMPRGFLPDLLAGLDSAGFDVDIIDKRAHPPVFRAGKKIVERDHQPAAVQAILDAEHGMWKAPPGCVSGDTAIHLNRAGKGFTTSIEKAHRKFNGLGGRGPAWDSSIPTYCRSLVDGCFRQHLVEDIVYSGVKSTLLITLESGKQIRCTEDHKIMREISWRRAGDLEAGDMIMVNGRETARFLDKDGYVVVRAPEGHHRAFHIGGPKHYRHGYVREHILVAEEKYGRKILLGEIIHHEDENKSNSSPGNLSLVTPTEHNVIHKRFKNLHGGFGGKGGEVVFIPKWERVVSIRDAGPCETYDMVMQNPHNNFVANGMVVHNSGKTVGVLQAGRRAGTKCIIIVNTKDVMYQWVDRIKEHLGLDGVGRVGGGHMEIGHIWTVAMAQTLASRFDVLEEDGFFDTFGFMCVDESHHAQAETYLKIINRFSARWRIGVSATPDKTGDFLLAQMVLGPIIHVTTHEGLIEKGHLIKPQIIQVKTDFKHKFKSTTSRWSRTNYPEVVEALMNDPQRNKAIVSTIMRESGHHCLVLTKRHEHIDLLEAMLLSAGYEFETARLTGKEKTAERVRVIKLLGNEPCCVFSTLADEALDIPRVDRGYLVFPQKNVGLIEQQVGRFGRTHPDKKDSILYDFADVECGPFKAQWTARWTGLYKRRGLQVIRKSAKDYL